MMPGPEILFECPQCGHLLREKTYLSGNTFGASFYSDGKRIAPMLGKVPAITKCPDCDFIFWVNDAKEVGEKWTVGSNYEKSWVDNVEECRFLSVYDYAHALKEKIYKDNEEEFHLAIGLHWAFNDRVRNEESIFGQEGDKEIWKENIYRLLLMTEGNSDYNLFRAELYRNLGAFDQCAEIIDLIRNSSEEADNNRLKMLTEHCSKRNTLIYGWNQFSNSLIDAVNIV